MLKLEQTITGSPCPECGSGDYTAGRPTYELLFDDEWEELGEDIPDESVYCETCGELIWGIVEVEFKD